MQKASVSEQEREWRRLASRSNLNDLRTHLSRREALKLGAVGAALSLILGPSPTEAASVPANKLGLDYISLANMQLKEESASRLALRNLADTVYADLITGNLFAMGNIGIGTTNPVTKLHVAGDINVTGRVYNLKTTVSTLNPGSNTGTLFTLPPYGIWIVTVRTSAGYLTHGQTTAIVAYTDAADKVVSTLSNQGYQWNGVFSIDNNGNLSFTNNGAAQAGNLVFTLQRIDGY